MLAELDRRQLDGAAIDRMLEFIAPDAHWHVFAWSPPSSGTTRSGENYNGRPRS
jgi:hypothetical protein